MYELPFGHGEQWGNNWNGVTNAVPRWLADQPDLHRAERYALRRAIEQGTPAVRPDLVGNPYAWTDQRWTTSTRRPLRPCPPTSQRRRRCAPAHFGRNTLIGPGFDDVDFSTFKDFRITERFTTQFRAEFFNLTQHASVRSARLQLHRRQLRQTHQHDFQSRATDPVRSEGLVLTTRREQECHPVPALSSGTHVKTCQFRVVLRSACVLVSLSSSFSEVRR